MGGTPKEVRSRVVALGRRSFGGRGLGLLCGLGLGRDLRLGRRGRLRRRLRRGRHGRRGLGGRRGRWARGWLGPGERELDLLVAGDEPRRGLALVQREEPVPVDQAVERLQGVLSLARVRGGHPCGAGPLAGPQIRYSWPWFRSAWFNRHGAPRKTDDRAAARLPRSLRGRV